MVSRCEMNECCTMCFRAQCEKYSGKSYLLIIDIYLVPLLSPDNNVSEHCLNISTCCAVSFCVFCTQKLGETSFEKAV